MVSSRMSSVYASLKVLPTEQGTRMILETDSMWKFDCLIAFILFEISPPLIYISTKRGASAGYAIFGVVFMISIMLLFALLNRVSETDLIDFFEHDVLGIKRT